MDVGAEIQRHLRGAITLPAEDICEDDIMRDSDDRRFRVLEVQVKPKTVVLRLMLLDPTEAPPFRLKRGEMVEVERG